MNLIDAIIVKQDVKIIEKLINSNNVNNVNKNGDTAILYASRYSNLNIVKLLIKSGANVNYQDAFGYTALMFASIRGFLDIVKYLIKSGADINYQNKNGETALIHSLNYNHLKIAKFLIKSNTNVAQTIYNPLIIVSCLGYFKLVKLLIESGADVNYQNKYGETALIQASKKNNLEIIKLLIKSGADINHQNKDGDTALILALLSKNFETAKLLLKLGFNIDYTDKNGDTALTKILKYAENVPFKLTSDIICWDVDTYLEESDAVELITILINLGANIYHQNKNEDTALIIASRCNFSNIIKLLLRHM